MLLPERWSSDSLKQPNLASIDRINCTLGYTRGNIQLVTAIANYCKHVWTNDDVLDFAKSVYKYNTTTLKEINNVQRVI